MVEVRGLEPESVEYKCLGASSWGLEHLYGWGKKTGSPAYKFGTSSLGWPSWVYHPSSPSGSVRVGQHVVLWTGWHFLFLGAVWRFKSDQLIEVHHTGSSLCKPAVLSLPWNSPFLLLFWRLFSSFISLAFLMRIHSLSAPFALPGSMLVLTVSALWPLLPTATFANVEPVFRPPISVLPMFLWQPVWQTVMHEVKTNSGKRKSPQNAACCVSSRTKQTWLNCTTFHKTPKGAILVLLWPLAELAWHREGVHALDGRIEWAKSAGAWWV